jgi:hypothetical protein
MNLEDLVLISLPFVLGFIYLLVRARDNPTARSKRNISRREKYDAEHRRRRSVYSRAGHHYRGDEFGPFGKSVAYLSLIAIFVAGIASGSAGVLLVLIAFWAALFKDRMH